MSKIKICGLTRAEDVKKVVDLAVDYVGLNFYENSPRYIAPADAEKLRGLTHGTPTKAVGVFVNEPLENLVNIVRQVGLDIAQLHGDESPAYIDELHTLNIPCWKAFRISRDTEIEPEQMQKYHTDYLLFDNASDGFGGSGKTFDWARLAGKIPQGKRFILAGGISADNLKEALKLKPYAVDVNSRIESVAGVKSHAQMEKIVEMSRNG